MAPFVVVHVVHRVRVHGLSLHEKVVYHRGHKLVDTELVDKQVVLGGSYMEPLVADSVVLMLEPLVADSVVLVLDSAALVVVAVHTVVVVALAGRGSPHSSAAAF